MNILERICKFIDFQKCQSLEVLERIELQRKLQHQDFKKYFLITEGDLTFLRSPTVPSELARCQQVFEKIDELSEFALMYETAIDEEFQIKLRDRLKERNVVLLTQLRSMLGPQVTEEDLDLPLSEIAKKYHSDHQ